MGLKAGSDVMTAADRRLMHEKALHKVGRPALPAGQKKSDNIFLFGVKPDEAVLIRKEAKKYDISPNQFCSLIIRNFVKTGQKI